MFRIEEDKIFLTRGDKATIELSIENYIFKSGDIINFRLYNKKALDKEPLIDKEIKCNKESEIIDIELLSQETKIGDLSNIEETYWYEIELNHNQTILGYDENGAKILILYPEGATND